MTFPSIRRITVVMDDIGISAVEGAGEAVAGGTAPEALGAWVYAHRHELGIEIELVTRRGVFLSPKEIVICAS